MKRTNSVILFLILLLLAAIFLRVSGVVDFSSMELLAAIFMLAGIAIAYSSFGNNRKGLLFTGSVLFLSGILVFINAEFDLESTRTALFPSVLMISGTGFFILFLDDTTDRLYLILSAVFFLSGMIYIVFSRSAGLSGFFTSFISLVKSYWVVLLLIVGLLIIIRKEL